VLGAIDRHHCPLNLVRKAAIIVEPLGQVFRLRDHLRYQLAVVAHFDLREMLSVLLNQRSYAAQRFAAGGLRQQRPGPGVEGLGGGLHGNVDVGLVAFGDQRPRIARVGIKRLERPAGDGVYPLAVDVRLISF
jgi:hypothetical protein